MKILIVDDDPGNRVIARRMLERHGGVEAMHIVDSGAACLETAAKVLFDTILLDISMPGMSGDDVCREIKRTPGGPRVVAFTAHVMPDEIESIMAAGFDGLVTKPFTQDQLLGSLWGD